MNNIALGQDFQANCREWRQFRKLSQLELAMEANVSQRHISWLETGRSKPSREMVVRLAEALEVPLRERNTLLQSAGFAPMYRESALEAPDMAPVLDALNRVLAHHDPFPAIVIDRFWNIVLMNEAGKLLFGLAELGEQFYQDLGDSAGNNLAALTLHPDGFRQFIRNWDQAAPAFFRRLRNEVSESRDPEYLALLNKLLPFVGDIPDQGPSDTQLLPVLPLEISNGELHLSLFSVISTFGTPQDITTDELRVESFYPSDTATQDFFTAALAAK